MLPTTFLSSALLLLASTSPSLALPASDSLEPRIKIPGPMEEIHTGVITTYHPRIKVGIITADGFGPKYCHFNGHDTTAPAIPLEKGFHVSYFPSVKKGRCTAHDVTIFVPIPKE